MKKEFLIASTILLISLFSFIVSANQNSYFEYGESGKSLISGAGVKYDENIENKFFYNSRVYIIITLKDNSGVILSGTKEEKFEQLQIQDEWFKREIKKMLESISDNDFILNRELPKGFAGFINQEGFEKLKNMEEIEAIGLNYIKSGQGFSTFPFFYLKWYFYLFLIFILVAVILIILKIRKKREHDKKK